jgi:16S rRNA (cytosine967-C5)-methyltransferase
LEIAFVKISLISPARRAAFEILQRVEEGSFANILLAKKEAELKQRDRTLCHELVMGVLRRQLWLDQLTKYYASREVLTLDPGVRIAVRLGLYQLRFLSRIPVSAAVNESVNLMRLARLRSAEGFVNAILRRATRETAYDPVADVIDPVDRLSLETSHPRWLIERWTEAFGIAEAEAIARANNEPSLVAFRVVRTKANETEILDRLTSAGAKLSASEVAMGAWRVSGATNLVRDLVRSGEIYLQDEASQLVAEVLGAKVGERVLDLCAAPGSKTTQIADLAADSLSLVAADLHEHRLALLARAIKSQHLKSIRRIALNGLESLPFLNDSFERVLVDAPCSGTGTFRRNPEIRYRISNDDIRDLSTRQNRLLFNASRVVKPGGRLVYSTCSIEREENEAVVKAFLEANSEFAPVRLQVKSSLVTDSGAARTWPHRNDTDGFFITALQRNKL